MPGVPNLGPGNFERNTGSVANIGTARLARAYRPQPMQMDVVRLEKQKPEESGSGAGLALVAGAVILLFLLK